MNWKQSVMNAIIRQTRRNRSCVFSRQQLKEEELGRIKREVGSHGKTPVQTLSRVLQDLRSEKKIVFKSPGTYRLLH
jgi:hypothetical protein